MTAWGIWTWPWEASIEMWRRSLEAAGALTDAVGGKQAAPEARELPEWTTPNHIMLDLAALRLRDASTASGGAPVVVIAPFALHDAQIADLAPSHSLLEALLRNGCSRLYLVEWKSATASTKLHTIDTQLSSLNVAIDDIGGPVDMVGLCQGGWLSLIYAARFPKKVRRLVLVGAPVDVKAAPSALTAPMNSLSHAIIDELVGHGHGLLLGRDMSALWPRDLDDESRILDSLQLPPTAASEADRKTVEIFRRWDRRALDLPAPYYRQVFDWLYCENRLAAGAFPALGRAIDLMDLRCPMFVLAGERDVIAPPAQVLAVARLVSSSAIETALAPCGHLGLFMGRETLETEWPRVSRWLLKRSRPARPSGPLRMSGFILAIVFAANTLLGLECEVIDVSRATYSEFAARLDIAPCATHLFEEPGTLEVVVDRAREWFARHLAAGAD